MTTTPADLFAQTLSLDADGDVQRVNVPLARQAIDLHLSMGGDLKTLLQPYRWWFWPHCVLSLVLDGDDFDRECRLYAVWCARQVLHLARPEDRPTFEHVLEVATRYAHGNATAQEMGDARVRAEAAVGAVGAAFVSATYDVNAAANAAYAAADVDATARAAQQQHLINKVCAALQ